MSPADSLSRSGVANWPWFTAVRAMRRAAFCAATRSRKVRLSGTSVARARRTAASICAHIASVAPTWLAIR
jgi:aminoglycoside phosphotransferase (APT) family kinase protein